MDVGTILPLGAGFIFVVRKRPVLDLAALVVCYEATTLAASFPCNFRVIPKTYTFFECFTCNIRMDHTHTTGMVYMYTPDLVYMQSQWAICAIFHVFFLSMFFHMCNCCPSFFF
jgi:hypothetical protein